MLNIIMHLGIVLVLHANTHMCRLLSALQARVAKYIAAEAEWLRLLCEELQPVMTHLQDNTPSRSAPKARLLCA